MSEKTINEAIADALECTIPERDMEDHCKDIVRSLNENGFQIVTNRVWEFYKSGGALT